MNNQFIERRTTFDTNALLYRQIRPSYPEALFESLVKTTKLHTGAHLLEIGPGTGQATEPLAKRGYKIIAIELGSELASVARETLKDYPDVQVLTGAFEDIELPEQSFDLVYSATAFHWIRPEIQFTKPHNLLKPNGYLAIIHTNHVSDEKGDAYFFATQPIYKKYDPTDDQDFRFPKTADLKPTAIDTNLFDLTLFETFPMVIKYTAEQYAALLNTYSSTLAMTPEVREQFLGEIISLINREFGGQLTKHFAMSLTVAAKKS